MVSVRAVPATGEPVISAPVSSVTLKDMVFFTCSQLRSPVTVFVISRLPFFTSYVLVNVTVPVPPAVRTMPVASCPVFAAVTPTL